MSRVNIGCGQNPTPGWNNYDNSLSVWLAKHPFLFYFLKKLKILKKSQEEFILFASKHDIKWADATKSIPEPDNSVEVLYASHVIEHLDSEEISLFLKEAKRILTHGGTLRISVPDLNKLVNSYIKDGDSNKFVSSLLLVTDKPKTLVDRVLYLLVGERNHKWMYDGRALCDLLSSSGFINPQVIDAGKTNTSEPGNLDLFERSEESVYCEAKKP